MDDNWNLIKFTIKSFKSYEMVSFISFAGFAVYFAFTSQWVSILISLLACIWVFTSSGWRQTTKELENFIDEN